VPLIVVVTGEEGREFGYVDSWDDERVLHYFGAGQEGDMDFVQGNLALRDDAENGEDVHLFEQRRRGLASAALFAWSASGYAAHAAALASSTRSQKVAAGAWPAWSTEA
jgi:hypothetical protein